MSAKHGKRDSGKKKAVIISVVAAAAVIAAIVCIAVFSVSNSESNVTETTVSVGTTAEEAVEETTSAESEETTAVESSEAVTETTAVETASTAVQSTSKAESIVVPNADTEDASYFSAEFTAYKAVDTTDNDRECALREIFGSSYSGGTITFNSDGTFSDTLGLSSVQSGAYVLVDSEITATYSNDSNLSGEVTSWDGDSPTEIIIHYGDYDLYFY